MIEVEDEGRPTGNRCLHDMLGILKDCNPNNTLFIEQAFELAIRTGVNLLFADFDVCHGSVVCVLSCWLTRYGWGIPSYNAIIPIFVFHCKVIQGLRLSRRGADRAILLPQICLHYEASVHMITSMKLLDQVRQKMRAGHYAYRTEQAYVQWVKRFILYHAMRHPVGWPEEMGSREIEAFLSNLAVGRGPQLLDNLKESSPSPSLKGGGIEGHAIIIHSTQQA